MSDRAQKAFELWIRRITMRSDLSASDIALLRSLPYEEHEVRTNHDFVRMGELVTHACLVSEGVVGRFGQTVAGHRQITALHIPGDMVDLHSVVVPRSSSALQALSHSHIVQVPHEAMKAVAAKSPALARAFWRDCVVDAMILSEWVVNIGRRQAKPRIAHLLCELAVRYALLGHARDDFPFNPTQIHLADLSGLTTVHINRTMRSLAKDGIVSIRSRSAVVHDWSALAALGDFDPAYLHVPDARLAEILARPQ